MGAEPAVAGSMYLKTRLRRRCGAERVLSRRGVGVVVLRGMQLVVGSRRVVGDVCDTW